VSPGSGQRGQSTFAQSGLGAPPVSQIAPASVHVAPHVLQFKTSIAVLTHVTPQQVSQGEQAGAQAEDPVELLTAATELLAAATLLAPPLAPVDAAPPEETELDAPPVPAELEAPPELVETALAAPPALAEAALVVGEDALDAPPVPAELDAPPRPPDEPELEAPPAPVPVELVPDVVTQAPTMVDNAPASATQPTTLPTLIASPASVHPPGLVVRRRYLRRQSHRAIIIPPSSLTSNLTL
jgi:hypothetical protein